MATGKRKLAVPNSFEVLPLIKGLEEDFTIVKTTPADCTSQLIKGSVSMALIPPIEYAKNMYEHELLIIPKFCISSYKESKNSVLILAPNKQQIASVAFRLGNISELIITRILFLENYNIELKFVPSIDDIETALKKSDSIILTGDESFQNCSKYQSTLFLAEEWFDLTTYPFISSIFAANENKISIEEVKYFQEVLTDNIADLACDQDEVPNPENYDTDGNVLFHGCNYNFNDREQNALVNFYELAFNYGIIEDIPDLKFYSLY